jgi:hypothetical protein
MPYHGPQLCLSVASVDGHEPGREGSHGVHVPEVYRRKLILKANFESGSSHVSFKRGH